MTNVNGSWEPVQRLRAHEQVMSQIEARLLSGELKAGDQLPSERELSSLLGVSRSSLRESLRVLEALGIIEVRRGGGPDSGAVVRQEPGTGFAQLLRLDLALQRFTSNEVLQTRLLLEEWSCAQAADLATAGDIAELQGFLDQMDDPAITTAAFNSLDTAFHVRIAEASGNSLIAHLMGSLRLAIHRQMVTTYAQLPDWRETIITVRAEHRAILKSINDHDPEVAKTLIRRHIQDFYTVAFPGIPRRRADRTSGLCPDRGQGKAALSPS